MIWLVDLYVDIYCVVIPAMARFRGLRAIRKAGRDAGLTRQQIAMHIDRWERNVNADLAR